MFLSSSSFWLYFTAVICVWIFSISLMRLADWRWYKSLPHSELEPPGLVFGIVWSMLYILMIAIGYIGDKDLQDSNLLLPMRILFGVSLGLNVLWTIVFFIAKNPILSLLILVLYILVIINLIVFFATVNSIATYLCIPLLVWLLFALYLNMSTANINRSKNIIHE